LNVAAGFAAGALAVLLLERYLARGQDVVPGRRLGSTPPAPQDDAQLREEVRSRLGQWVSHPGAIDVDVQEGVVRVSGQVLATELDGLLLRLTQLAGVRKVRNALTALRDPSGFGEVARPQAPSPLH
jgi:hypothetical protein